MATGIVGYKLIKIDDNSVVNLWGGSWGTCPGIPNTISLPNGDQICAPFVNVEYNGYKLIPWEMEEPQEPVPESISDRQFFQQANVSGYITQNEALLAVKTGEIPNTLNVIVNTITDSNIKFSAEMLLSGATVFYRNHPLVSQIGLALNITDDEIDTFFKEANKL